MGFGAKLLGLFTPSGDTIKGVAEGVGTVAKDLRESITGEGHKLSMEEVKAKVTESYDQIILGLQEISKLEVQGNWFQRSWRPGLAWVIIIAIAIQYPVYLLANWICEWAGVPLPPPPDAVSAKDLWPIILGLIGYRTIEKSTGL